MAALTCAAAALRTPPPPPHASCAPCAAMPGRPLVERRLRVFSYLKDVYSGNQHFLSVASISPGGGSSKEDGLDETLGASTCHERRDATRARTLTQRGVLSLCPPVLRWFYLGVSLATLLPQPPGVPFVRAVLQLLEEHQYHFASSTERNIKIIRARPAVKHGGGGGGDDELTPALQRSGGKVLYEYLLTPHVAHALSGVQVAIGLCELMVKLYRKLAESPTVAGATPALVEVCALS